jgi:(S)-3,5-dihydroxyphenylglycine transaminase
MAAHGDLDIADLHSSLTDPALLSMNFLNEVAGRFPDAISFAAGRPCEEFFDVAALPRYLPTYCSYLETELGYDAGQVQRTLFQYGPTKGIINELIARHLAADESLLVDPPRLS